MLGFEIAKEQAKAANILGAGKPASSPDLLKQVPKPISRFSDLNQLRADTNFEDAATSNKPLLVPVRRPSDEKCIRVCPGPDFMLQDIVIRQRSADRKEYLFSGAMANLLQGRQSLMTLKVCVDRQNNISLWPIRQNRPGKVNDWNTSALDAAAKAEHEWVYIVSGAGCYGAKPVLGEERIANPDWKAIFINKKITRLGDILEIAFPGERFVQSIENPYMQELLYGAIAP